MPSLATFMRYSMSLLAAPVQIEYLVSVLEVPLNRAVRLHWPTEPAMNPPMPATEAVMSKMFLSQSKLFTAHASLFFWELLIVLKRPLAAFLMSMVHITGLAITPRPG